MLFNINFNQKELLNVLPTADAIDAVIIAGLQSMFAATSSKMKRICVNHVSFVWIAVDHLKKELPIIGIKSKRGLLLRMEKLLNSGIIKRIGNGNKSYYSGGDKRDQLWYQGMNHSSHPEPELEEVGTTVHTSGMNHSSHNHNTILPYPNTINISKDIFDDVADATPSDSSSETLPTPSTEQVIEPPKEKDSAEKEKVKPVPPTCVENPTVKERKKYQDELNKYNIQLKLWELDKKNKSKPKKVTTDSPPTKDKPPSTPPPKPKKGPDPVITGIIKAMDSRYKARDPGSIKDKRFAARTVKLDLVKHPDVKSGKTTEIKLFENILGNAVKDKFRGPALINLKAFHKNINQLTTKFYQPPN